MDQKQFEEINEKLGVILRLLSLDLAEDLKGVTEKVKALSSCGFQPKEIAILLNKEPNNIYRILHRLKTKEASPNVETAS